ncbi:hypothetical protein PJP14_29415, partial [Mycobacterium kansasii]
KKKTEGKPGNLRDTRKSQPKSLHVINVKEFERDYGGFDGVCLSGERITPKVSVEGPPEVKLIMDEFHDVFPEELPDELSPMRDIQHDIDLV